jgi:uncharacterized protein YbjT (DUF2867 family)
MSAIGPHWCAVMTKVAIVGATDPTGIHLAAELRKTAAAVRVVAPGRDKLARLFPDAAVEYCPNLNRHKSRPDGQIIYKGPVRDARRE